MQRLSQVLSFVLLALPALAQDPPVDAGLPDRLKELRALVKDPKMTADLRALDIVDSLATEPDKRNPRDLDRIVDAIGDVFRLGKVRPPAQIRLYEHAADALAKIGKRSGKTLHAAFADPRFKDREYAPVRAAIVAALGHTRDDTQVDFLLEQALRAPDDAVIAAAGDALGNFPDLEPTKLRDVVKRMISRYGDWAGQASQLDSPKPGAPIDPGPENARNTLRAMQGKWNDTLAKLTGQSFTEAADWQRWLNKNRDWVRPGQKN